ncbi:MAG: hypothetical protein WD768_13880 [Phycisphaeraceae bacterium]
MADWKKLLHNVLLADGVIDAPETAALKKEILADGIVDDEEVDFLVALRNASKKPGKEFEAFFFAALTANLLADGVIDAAEAKKLRTILFADGKIDAGEKAFLKNLKAKAKKAHASFDKLYDECMKA